MKVIKYLLKIYGIYTKVMILIIATGILLIGCSSTEVEQYLKKNNTIVNLDDVNDFSGLEILEDDLKDKKIIFTGESHTINKDNLFKIKLIKYLQKEIGLNYYLDESGYSNAYFYNKYLETGNETILHKAFSYIKGTRGYNEDDYNFYKELYKFNQSLPKGNRIKIVGVDIEHTNMTSHDFILDIISDKSLITDDVQILLDNLILLQSGESNFVEVNKSVDRVLEAIDNDNELYKELFRKDYFGFKLVLENIKAMCKAYSNDLNFTIIREEQIYKNFEKIDKKIDNAKYFGQWGGYHVLQEAFVDQYNSGLYTNYFASKLNKSEKYKDKVISLYYGYYNERNIDSALGSIINKELFKKYINNKENCMIFKLNGKESPFTKDFIWPYKTQIVNKENTVTTDYTQYIVLIKDYIESKEPILDSEDK